MKPFNQFKILVINNIIITLLCLFGVMACLNSCDKNDIVTTPQVTVKAKVSKDQLKRQFALAFARVISENKDIRDIIKEEAIKKIDYDYDVLYQLVRGRKDKDNHTIEENILKYLSADSLSLIIHSLPTLTIFVPELPEEAFSAEIWNTDKMIPEVAVHLSSTNQVPIFDKSGNETLLNPNEIPLFPVIVIKENERIVINNSPFTRQIAGNQINGVGLMFADDIFNNNPQEAQTRTRRESGDRGGTTRPGDSYIPTMDSRFRILKEAYKNNINGWQRDYVYYGIHPSNPNGPFNNQYRECIWGFEMLGDPNGVLKKISDQPDEPQFINSNWTDGEFEFQVKTYVGSKTAVGNELITYFRISPSKLFGLKRDINRGSREINGGTRPIYTISSLTNNRVLFRDPIPLFPWNLEDFSSSIKISIEEVDATQVIRQLTSTDTEFAANFDYDFLKGDNIKMGPKFGASAKIKRTVTYEVTTTAGNDELGQVIVNFGDPILKDTTAMAFPPDRRRDPPYYLNMTPQYTTGWYRVYIAPGPIF